MTIPRVGLLFNSDDARQGNEVGKYVALEQLTLTKSGSFLLEILISKSVGITISESTPIPDWTSRITPAKVLSDDLTLTPSSSIVVNIPINESVGITISESVSVTKEDKLAAPTGLTGAEGVLDQVDLDWTDNASGETEYIIQRAADSGGSPGTYSDYVTGLPANTQTDSPTQPYDSTYWYRVYCTDGTYDSPYSNEVSVYKSPL